MLSADISKPLTEEMFLFSRYRRRQFFKAKAFSATSDSRMAILTDR